MIIRDRANGAAPGRPFPAQGGAFQQQQQQQQQLQQQQLQKQKIAIAYQQRLLKQQQQQQPVKKVTFEEKEKQVSVKPSYVASNNPSSKPYYRSASYIFSAEYAQRVGQKPRATTSASIGLGGIIGVTPRR